MNTDTTPSADATPGGRGDPPTVLVVPDGMPRADSSPFEVAIWRDRIEFLPATPRKPGKKTWV